MTNISKESSISDHNHVRDKYHQCGHTECRIDIGIDGAEVVVPARWRESKNPIETKTIEICSENIEKNTPNKPECF